MAKVTIPVANGFYVSDSLPLSAQQCVNWYPSTVEVPALNQEVLFGTPGMTEVQTTGTTPASVNRGSHVMAGIPYFVNGNKLYRLNRTIVSNAVVYTVTILGTITGTRRVSMADNGNQLCIVVPGNPSTGYIFTASPASLQVIADPDFKANGEPQAVVFIDGYFVFTLNNKKFIVSAINNGLAYNALDFGSAEADPDVTVLPIVLHNQLFIAGSQTIEQFQNIGGAGFPFQRTGLFASTGATSQFLATPASESFMFVGAGQDESPAVWQFVGNGVERRSTIAIDTILQKLTPEEIAISFAWSYAQRGGYFVCFTFPQTTLVYDTITGKWHERKSHLHGSNPDGFDLVRCRVNSLVSAYGEVYVGDSQDGRIGRLDPEIYTEYDRPLLRIMATQPFQNQGESFSVPSLELTVESGVGNAACPEPMIRMDRSLNGKTWKDERARKIGRVGHYGHRAIWRRNGRAARFEIFRFTMSDPVKPVILQLVADIV